jgi:hypothetical protein
VYASATIRSIDSGDMRHPQTCQYRALSTRGQHLERRYSGRVFAQLPVELKPEYNTAEINDPIVLHEGGMELVQDGKSWHGTGIIRFEWLPFSRVAARFHPSDQNGHIELKTATIRIAALKTEADFNVSRAPWAYPDPAADPVEGILRQVTCGDLTACVCLRFHIPNLPQWIGDPVRTQGGGSALKRFLLRHGDWDVTLDAIKFESRDYQILKQTGGYLLTHVGTLARRDGAPFSFAECEPLLECLSYFLSFCRGARTLPILVSAEDSQGQVIGRRWTTGLVDRYRSTCSWVPSTEPFAAGLQSAFAGFAKAWFSQLWGDALRTVTQWYVESSTGAAEKSIILIQAALEVLAWVRLVQDKRILTEKNWKDRKNTFASKLRTLLSLSSIMESIPADLAGLDTYCRDNQLSGGPEGITSVRNALVHPSPVKRARLKKHPSALIDAWLLASWYLDLSILSACGYQGRYSNRTVRNGWKGDEVEVVPWC